MAVIAMAAVLIGASSLTAKRSPSTAPADVSTTVEGVTAAAAASTTVTTKTVRTSEGPTQPPTTAPPTTTATTAPPTTTAPIAYSCSSAGSTGAGTPQITKVVNPNPQTYAASGDFQVFGSGLDNVTEELLCPTGTISATTIAITSGPFSYSGSQLNLYVPSGLVAGAIYDVRVVANGKISPINSTDRLYVANSGSGSASA